MVEACVFYSLIGALDPKLHFNDGMRDVVRFEYAPNTITNASAPGAGSSYQAANLKLVDVILQALAPFVRTRRRQWRIGRRAVDRMARFGVGGV